MAMIFFLLAVMVATVGIQFTFMGVGEERDGQY